jgi:hypothetical protein
VSNGHLVPVRKPAEDWFPVDPICRAQRMPLATRNLADFRKTGIEVINPWQGVRRS